MKTHFKYLSKDNETMIHAVSWEPEGEPKAILQICHGMQEFIERYDPFATFLAGQGYYVVGNDHLGHGESVTSDEKHGYFAKKDGNGCLVSDIHMLRTMTQEKFPDVPYFILGHSMGSYLLRNYLELHGEGLCGAVIVGTGYQGGGMLTIGMLLCRIIALFHSWDYHSKMLTNMAFGSYNKAFEPVRTPADWLTKDEEIVDAYLANPWCTFQFTVNGYFNLFRTIKNAQNKKLISQIPKDLPMLLTSGADDPVGAAGEGVKKAFQLYKEAGIKDLSIKLYENDRHEILNETDRDVVWAEIYSWLTKHNPAGRNFASE